MSKPKYDYDAIEEQVFELLDENSSETDITENDESTDLFIDSVVNHFMKAPGKLVRTELLLSMFDKRGRVQGRVPEDGIFKAKTAAKAIETMHLASIVHDDILDDAKLRRDLPSLNAKFGTEVALIAGDVLFARALAIMGNINDGYAISQMMKALRTMSEGQLRECAWSEVNAKPSKNDVLEVLRQKTGALFGLASRLGAYFAMVGDIEADDFEDLDSFADAGERFGIGFQLQDDLNDLEEDKARGVLTFPLLFGTERTQQIIDKLQSESI